MERAEIERLLTWPSDRLCERTFIVFNREGMGELLRLALLGKRVEEAPVGEVVELGDDEEGQPRVLIHSTRDELRKGRALVFKRVALVGVE